MASLKLRKVRDDGVDGRRAAPYLEAAAKVQVLFFHCENVDLEKSSLVGHDLLGVHSATSGSSSATLLMQVMSKSTRCPKSGSFRPCGGVLAAQAHGGLVGKHGAAGPATCRAQR